MSNNTLERARLGIGIAGALLLASCAGAQQAAGSDKAGGDADPVVLTMADATWGGQPAVHYFIDQVAELSDGSLRIDVTNEWGGSAPAPDVAQQVVRDVAAGEADLAWVWTHAFDSLDVDAFRALNAPMLIDSYPLQRAVIASDIPGEMLPALDAVGVTGIAVLAESMYKAFAVEGPLLSPADYEGITFTSRPSSTFEEAISALGANAEVAIADGRIAGLTNGEIQGFEMNLAGYAGGAGQLQYLAPYGTANVNLWGNPAAIIVNPNVLADLTDTQREWMMQAAAAASEQSTDLVDDDAELVAQLCESGSRFADASDADLAAMRETFEPVYASLEQDAQTAEFIARIEELKAATDPGLALEIPADCTGVSPLVEPAPADTDDASGDDQAVLNGVYRWTVTADDVRDAGVAIPAEAEIAGTVNTVTLDDGTWTWNEDNGFGAGGSYTIDGDTITFDDPAEGARTDFTFTSDEDGTLHLHPVGSMNPVDALVWTSKPWERIDSVDVEEPPTVPIDGTYRWTITRDDALAYGTPDDQTPEGLASFPSTFTVTLDGGRWTMRGANADGEWVDCDGSEGCTYTIDGRTVTFDQGGAKLVFTFTADEDGTLHLEMVSTNDPGALFVMTTKPWEKIDGDAPDEPTEAVLDGTYRWTLTEEDVLAHGTANDMRPEELASFPWTFTVTLDGGKYSMRGANAQEEWVDCDGSDDCWYAIDGDTVTFNEAKEGLELVFTFTADEDGTLHLEMVSPNEPGVLFVMTTKPWERLD